jgi:hypothetical protein
VSVCKLTLLYTVNVYCYCRFYSGSSSCDVATLFNSQWSAFLANITKPTPLTCFAAPRYQFDTPSVNGTVSFITNVYLSIMTTGLPTSTPTAMPSVSQPGPVPASTPTGPSSLCFAGTETVVLSDGSRKMMVDVVVGDSILSANAQGQTKFATVVAVPHARNDQVAMFVQLTTRGGGDIKLSSGHLIMVDSACDSQYRLMKASSVKTGMCLVPADASMIASMEIESVKTVVGQGVYTVVTEEEFVVVNGFVASPFAVNHFVAHNLYHLIRAAPFVMDFKIMKEATLVFGSIVSSVGTLLN